MIFTLIQKTKISLFYKDYQLFRLAAIFLLFILSIIVSFVVEILAFSNILQIVFLLIVGALFLYYLQKTLNSKNFNETGKIEIDNRGIKINEDELFPYEIISQVKVFVGFYKNYTKGLYYPFWDGITHIEFYFQGKKERYAFIIYSKEQYIEFEKLVISIKSKYPIQVLDNLRKDNLYLPVLS